MNMVVLTFSQDRKFRVCGGQRVAKNGGGVQTRLIARRVITFDTKIALS